MNTPVAESAPPQTQPAKASAEPMPTTLRALLIPYSGGQVLLPNHLVAEVLPFASPLSLDNAPPWVAGTMLWKALTIPLIRLEYLFVDDADRLKDLHYSRIVVLQALADHPKLHYFALLSSAAPRIFELARHDIADTEEYQRAEPEPGILSRVKVLGQQAIIPDLNVLETQLNGIMSS